MDSDVDGMLWGLVSAATTMHVLRAFVVLGMPDAVPVEGISVVQLAAAIDAPPDRLRRLLHASSALGLCEVTTSDLCTLGPAGEALRSNVNGIRTWALLITEPWLQRAWDRLPEAIRNNTDDGFNAANGHTFWDYLASEPEAESLFDRAMAGSGPARARALTKMITRIHASTVVDVGGGDGSLLLSIVEECPGTRGILAERPAVLQGAARAQADPRITVVEADFFDRVPSGGDVYILSRVLHDHSDEPAASILRTCRAAMSTGSRLLIAESVVPERGSVAADERLGMAMKDLNMLVLVGGQERTLDEYRSLLAAAELVLEDVDSSSRGVDVLVAAPV